MSWPRTQKCSNCNHYDWSRVYGGALGTVQISVGSPVIITTANQLVINQPVVFVVQPLSGIPPALPAPLTLTTVYYVIPVDATHVTMASASGGTPVTTTTPGGGTFFCDPVILGCHYPAPDEQPTASITVLPAKWKPVDADNWCGFW